MMHTRSIHQITMIFRSNDSHTFLIQLLVDRIKYQFIVINQFLLLIMSHYPYYYSYFNELADRSPYKNRLELIQTNYKEKQDVSRDACMMANGHQFRNGKYYENKMKESQEINRSSSSLRKKVKDQKYQIYEVRRKVDNYLKIIEKDRNKQRYRPQYQEKNNRYLVQQLSHISPSKKKGTSPNKRINTQKNSPNKHYQTYSPQKHNSPSKTFTKHLEQIDHPSKRCTASGYYPVGMQIKSDGRYMLSTMRSVVGPSFRTSSPNRLSPNRTSPNSKYKNIGPGSYNYFSQFGPDHPTR